MKWLHRISLSVAALCAAVSPGASAQTQPTYETSWIGNSFGFGDGKWVQLDVEAISVGSDGTVYTNAPWDESGSEVGAYKGGSKVAVAGNTHGWGNAGGDAVASNGTYLYAGMSIGNESNALVGSDYPPSNTTWYGITRRLVSNIATGAPFASGIGNSANVTKNSFLRENAVPTGTDASIRGLAASATELYVANTYANQIEVDDANTMRRLRSWAVPSPGRILIDTDGTLWIIQGLQGATGRSIVHYSTAGALIGSAVSLPSGTVPVDLAISPSGQLLVADGGASQQILLYNKTASGQTSLAGQLGTRNGIFHVTTGVPGDWRFNGITGIGFDASGNLYVAQNGFGPRAFGSVFDGEGTVLESYAWSSQALNWRLYGLTFVDGGSFDPAEPASVFSGSKHFSLDYRQTQPGQEWSYAGFTLDRFQYPDDPALHLPKGVRGEPMVRRVNGSLLLYTIDMYSHYLSIYRFNAAAEGQVAIPSGLFAENPIPGSWPSGQPSYGEWMWRDANGDGHVDASEIQANPSSGNAPEDGFWWVDSQGNIWLGMLGSGIRELPLQGFDAYGNPVYTYASAKTYAMPQPFSRVARIVYDASSDAMYVSGYTSAYPYDSSHWKAAGRLLVRYDNWSSGTPQARYTIMLPWNVTADPQQTPVGVAVAGNYIFVAELYTDRVDVYDVRNGQQVGYMKPGTSVGGTSGWVDVYLGISAVERSTGEYVVLVEDDARAKILMYRWTP
ncbi:hypothetical protein FAZ69_02030 [Trinickia terrae]|uniref:SMP-30/gluconolaconase/LRE-like region family protein n=1 Tax=Trinickia terrae TaxID=2571161 RepID=A0A4U1IFI6_9BURK|nr:hypothetical protein [Trinickia terrae]TKC92478.1 hypothetical protein FAZ69_02030 [Trinickia terrae]